MTLTYLFPGSGATAATAAQARVAPTQVATVQFADADTTATIVHNYGYDAAALARGCPLVEVEQLTGGNPMPSIIIAKGTNNIVLTKGSTSSGSGGTIQVDLFAPHTILMPNT